jgi:ABC-2 type transport system ATP-binding protein
MAVPIIQTHQLSKTYTTGGRELKALDNLTLEVQTGEIFGYLGPNGAGKTTTIRLLLDLIRPTQGRASLFGLDAQKDSVAIHKRIGFLPGELNLWKNRTAAQVIYYIASIRGNIGPQLKESQKLSDLLKFDASKKVRDFSTGNKRKLGLILAMMHQPELLILDEPTNGLDPLMQQTFNQLMRDVRADGRTVFLSSHQLTEVQAICDRVAILRDGQLRAVQSVEAMMKAGFRYVDLQFRDSVPSMWQERLESIGAQDVIVKGDTVHLKLRGDFDPVMRVVANGYLVNVDVREPSLEEVFLTFYGDSKPETQKEAVR